MVEKEIRQMIAEVKDGAMPRRDFIRSMVAMGIAAPVASQLLMWNGVAMAQTAKPPYKPTKAGGGGTFKMLIWQAVTLINPHFAVGSKDQEGSRLFYEPLASWDSEGNLFPVLAAQVPTRENGGVAADGMSVTWKLKPGVKWHDGKPFTAEDCVFNWQYASNPATSAYTIGAYKDIKVEKVDDLTVKIVFPKPTPFWAEAFVGQGGMIIPKHLFADFSGEKSRDAPANLRPVGTGAYRFVEFKPGDILIGERNPDYHMPNRPFFDRFEMKGGGDAASAARAVLQTGEYDLGWNLQVEDEILKKMEEGGKGRVDISYGGNIEFIQLNQTDPTTEIDGERSSIKARHPTLTDPAVRQAISLLMDRESIQKFIYGRTGSATPNFLNAPERFRSKSRVAEFNIDKANKILDDAGWRRGSDGIRAKDGRKLKFLYQTSINGPRQKTQAIVKQAAQRVGIDIELKSVTASVFFSSDVANPDTYGKFYADMQMYTTTQGQPDPGVFMQQYISSEISNKDNKWQGRNITRWRNEEYDKLHAAAANELDPVKRAAMFVRMNDLVCNDNAVIPLIYRAQVAGVSSKLVAVFSGWDTYLWNVQDWFKEA